MVQVTKRQIIHELWHRGNLSYKLDALQQHISQTVDTNPEAKKIGILSSRQIGKSYWAVAYSLGKLVQTPNIIVRILAPTLKQASDIVRDNLLPMIADAPPGLITRKASEYRWDISNGSSLRLGALERAHVDNNRGGNASIVFYEEAGFIGSDDFDYAINSVIGPQLLRSNGREIFVSSPSEDPDHSLHTKILPLCEGIGTAFRYTVYDSPSITPEMITEAIRRCGGEDSDAFQREYLAKIIRPSTKMVIPSYSERAHVAIFEKPLECYWTITADWGGVRDFTVALLHTYDFSGDYDLIWDEKVWPANTPTDIIKKGMKDWEKAFPIHARWADVPGQLQVDLNQGDYAIALPQKSDWRSSVNAMSVKFSQNRIMIHPRCEFLRKSCRAGMFNKTFTDFGRESHSEIGHCDGLAALMYAIRCQDRTNPYVNRPTNDKLYVRHSDDSDLMKFSDSVGGKRFGAFR